MAHGGLSTAQAIDLSRPWFAPWAPWLTPVRQSLSRGDSVADALNALRLAPLGGVPGAAHHAALDGLSFVPQSSLPEGEAYEAFIFRTRCVPTRDNLHDLLNGVCWLRFPAIKRHLNAMQAEQIAAGGVGAKRGPVRDALTLLDENALLLCGPARLRDAHRRHDWHTLFVRERGLWAQTRVIPFGHALLEKLVQPYKSITAHLWRVPTQVSGATLDAWLAQDLQADKLATKPFSPLPVLGVPGWWPSNADPTFYDDPQVFRPRRERRLAASVEKP